MATTTINLNLAKDWYTVGTTGADYTTIQAAVDDGKKKLKLITDITTSADVTLPADYCLTIDLNTKIATFAANVQILNGYSVEVIDNTGYRKGEVRFSTNSASLFTFYQGITSTYSECRGIVVRNVTTDNGFFIVNNRLIQFFKKHLDSDYHFSKNVTRFRNYDGIEYADGCHLICLNTPPMFTENTEIYNSKISGTVLAPGFLPPIIKRYENVVIDITPDFAGYVLEADVFINVDLSNNSIDCNVRKYANNLTNVRYLFIFSFLKEVIIKNAKCIDFRNNGDNNNFDTIICSGNVTNGGSADKCVFRNVQYTGTATDNGTNTRVWEVFQN